MNKFWMPGTRREFARRLLRSAAGGAVVLLTLLGLRGTGDPKTRCLRIPVCGDCGLVNGCLRPRAAAWRRNAGRANG
jgi:hypothetical protein